MSPAGDIETLSLASIWTWVAAFLPALAGFAQQMFFIRKNFLGVRLRFALVAHFIRP